MNAKEKNGGCCEAFFVFMVLIIACTIFAVCVAK